MNPSRRRAALVILAIALGSALAGAGIDHAFLARGPRRGGGRGGPGSATPGEAARRRADMLGRMTRELGLSAAQRAGIDSVMQRTDSALRVVRAEMQPRLRQIFESSRAEITARLDSAQRVKFAKRDSSKRRR